MILLFWSLFAVVMVPCLLLSGDVIDSFSLLMRAVSTFDLTITLNDMREEIQNKNANCDIMMRKENLKIILWWAGTFLGKSLRDIMNKNLTAANLDSE